MFRSGVILLVVGAVAGLGLAVGSPDPARALDLDCANFSNQAEAQEYLTPGDPHRLDGDGDGRACEDLPCPCSYAPGTKSPEGPPPAEPAEPDRGLVYWKPFREPVEVEPTTLVIGTGTLGGTFRVGSLTDWRGWGSGRAVADGFIRMRTCDPSCVRGKLIKRPARVILTEIRSSCEGQQRYRTIKIRPRNAPISVIGPYGTNCVGALTF